MPFNARSSFLFSNLYSNNCNKLLEVNGPTYRVKTVFIQCTLNGYIRCNMSAQLQRGLGWSRPLLSFKVKILFDDFTYYDDNDDTEADTMMDVVYEVGSDDD